MIRVTQIHNAHVQALPRNARRRLWAHRGARVQIAPRHVLEVHGRAAEEGGPLRLHLVLHCPLGAVVLESPEDLGLYTTEALVRGVEYSADGVERVLLDLGELVTAPALWAAP